MIDSIIQKIADHKCVYEIQGKEVPPYRITYQEHIDLVEECAKFAALPGDVNKAKERYGFIAEFTGVMIQVVALIN